MHGGPLYHPRPAMVKDHVGLCPPGRAFLGGPSPPLWFHYNHRPVLDRALVSKPVSPNYKFRKLHFPFGPPFGRHAGGYATRSDQGPPGRGSPQSHGLDDHTPPPGNPTAWSGGSGPEVNRRP